MPNDFPVTFEFADGAIFDARCAPHESLLNAARRAAVPLLAQCESGACGTCMARLVSGDAPMFAGKSTSLLPSEYADGVRLTCQSSVTSPCVFRLDYASACADNEPEIYECNIDTIEWLAASVVRLRVAFPDDDWFEFVPGQFVQLKVPGTESWRSYSIASAPRAMPSMDPDYPGATARGDV